MIRSKKSVKVDKMFVLGKRVRKARNIEEWWNMLASDIEQQLLLFSNAEYLTEFVKDFWEEIKNNFDELHQKVASEVLHVGLLSHRQHHEAYIDQLNDFICEGNFDNKDKTSKPNKELSFDDWFNLFKVEFTQAVYEDYHGDGIGEEIKSAYKEISRFDDESQEIVIEWINEVVQDRKSDVETCSEFIDEAIDDYNLEDPKKAVEQIEDEDY